MLFPVDPSPDAGLPGFMKYGPGGVLFCGFALTLRVEIPIVRGEKKSPAAKNAGTGDKP
jgi:hypothetical protein